MSVPERLRDLVDEGLITDVVRPLMSGKEAQVYLVASGTDLGVAKVYKESDKRSFKHRADYTEGRTSRNSRDNRAMARGSRYGRAVSEAAWRSSEADIIYRLRDAGVRVPEPYAFLNGVLLMELITDDEGQPAPRLGETELDPSIAPLFFEVLLQDVVRMTHAGIVHGDLSEFNILVGPDGPVIIDFPQSVDAASNPHAKKLLLRDVENLVRFGARFQPELKGRPYGPELWDLYERAELQPDTKLTGRFRRISKKADTEAVLREIRDVEREHQKEASRQSAGPQRRGRSPARGERSGEARPGNDRAARDQGAPHRSGDRPAGRGGAPANRTGGDRGRDRRGAGPGTSGSRDRRAGNQSGAESGARGSDHRRAQADRGQERRTDGGRGPSPEDGRAPPRQGKRRNGPRPKRSGASSDSDHHPG